MENERCALTCRAQEVLGVGGGGGSYSDNIQRLESGSEEVGGGERESSETWTEEVLVQSEGQCGGRGGVVVVPVSTKTG